MAPTVRLATIIALIAALTAACSGSTSGVGSAARRPSTSSSADFPSTSASARPSSAPTAPTTSAGRAVPTLAERTKQLAAQTHGAAQLIVAVPGGYEAAVFDQTGNISFWHDAVSTTTWRQVGRSTYPWDAQLGTPPDATVQGALLHGMTHATFIVHGTFTTDGGGNAVAFTAGANGWGAIKAEPNGNIGPSGEPVGSDKIGLSYGFGFVGGKLQTQDCPTNLPIADCSAHPITKLWVWTGHDFRRA